MVGVGMCKELGGAGEVTRMQEGGGASQAGCPGAQEWTELTQVG